MKDASEHEACHALTAWVHGGRLSLVTVGGPLKELSDGQQTCAYCDYTDPTYNKRSRFLTMAAPLALRRNVEAFSDLNDIWQFMKELRPENLEHKEMAAAAWDLVSSDMLDPPSSAEDFRDRYQKPILEFYERFKELAEGFMDDENVQRCIFLLAQEINEKKCLSGYEVAEILERNWEGELPEKVLPKEKHNTNQTNPRSAEEAKITALALVSLAFDILRGHSDSDEVQRPLRAILQCLFQFRECSAKNS